MEKKITIVGHFGIGKNLVNGQTIKTKNIYDALIKHYGKEKIYILDTSNWKKHPIKLLLACINVSKKSSDIVILPAHKGIKIFIPLFVRLKKKYSFKLHYITIGSWLYDISNKKLREKMKNINFIYVENNKLKNKFEKIGFKNIYILKNFKNLDIIDRAKKYNNDSKLKMCIFSRIEKEKGILDAIEVTKKLVDNNYNVFLDIYGPVKDIFNEEFNLALKNCKQVNYKGIVDNKKSINIVRNYDILLFPTRYMTEGIPGTILDAYFAGIPVISSIWENFDDIVINNQTGIGYEFMNNEELYKKIIYILDNKDLLNNMSENCLKFARNYTPEKALKILFDNIGEKI